MFIRKVRGENRSYEIINGGSETKPTIYFAHSGDDNPATKDETPSVWSGGLRHIYMITTTLRDGLMLGYQFD